MHEGSSAKRRSRPQHPTQHPPMTARSPFQRLHPSADCCRHKAAFGPLACVAYGVELWRTNRNTAPTPAGCEAHCSENPACAFFSHSRRFRSCTYCSACDLTAGGLNAAHDTNELDYGSREALLWRPGYSSWAKGEPRRYERVDKHAVVRDLTTRWLQGNYSEQLYAGAGRINPETLRIIWLTLVPRGALRGLTACKHNAKPPLQPFFRPISNAHANDPAMSMWVHQNGPHEPIASHGWAEITHCPGPKDGPTWKGAAMWLYVAPGSGVSMNVGRTKVFRSFERAANFLANVYCRPPDCKFNVTDCPQSVETMASPEPPNGWRVVFKGGRAVAVPRIAADARTFGPTPNAEELDTIQILDHFEHYSHERRHEIVVLRQPECAQLRHDTQGLMCGRHPYLRPCPPNSAAVERVATCGKVGSMSASAKKITARLQRFEAQRCRSSPCYVGNDSHTYCPVGTEMVRAPSSRGGVGGEED